MLTYLWSYRFLSIFTCVVVIFTPLPSVPAGRGSLKLQRQACQSEATNFLAVGGGPSPDDNEIALEKNLLYFQRTLRSLGYRHGASTFFANGNDGKTTVRYVDNQDREHFKAPEIPGLNGAATITNLQRYFQQIARLNNNPLFFYFTGHGSPNEQNLDNNSLYLWHEQPLSVRQLAQILDNMPRQTSVVTMMAQCFSGSFANLIYEGGNPNRPVALQTRCGFFATVKTRPSVGCTAAVNEADYRDYSSSFFAGLSGRDRTGKAVTSADYNKDGRVSYAEAHAFAKVDEKSTDLPISTSEAWLRQHLSPQQEDALLSQPIGPLMRIGRPEQRYVVSSLVKMFSLNQQKSFLQNVDALSISKVSADEQKAYLTRLGMELVNIGREKQIRAAHNQKDIATLNRLLKCESGSWSQP